MLPLGEYELDPTNEYSTGPLGSVHIEAVWDIWAMPNGP
jgi:hypothetical protein